MEPSQLMEPSNIFPSGMDRDHDNDKEQEEEDAAEIEDIEAGVDNRMADMDDNGLNLVEEEDEEEEYINYHNYLRQQEGHQMVSNTHLNTFQLPENMAIVHQTVGVEQATHGQMATSTPFATATNAFPYRDPLVGVPGAGLTNIDFGMESEQERNFLHTDEVIDQNNHHKILYEARGMEIKRLNEELEQVKSNRDNEFRSMQHQLAILKGEHERVTAHAENLKSVADVQVEDIRNFKDEADLLKSQLAESENLKREMQTQLDSANITIEEFRSQLLAFQQSDTILRAKQTHEENIRSLRDRHENELFRLHREIEKHNIQAKAKDNELDNQRAKITKIQHDYDILVIEKSDAIKALQDRLDASQRRLQQQIAESSSTSYANVKAIEQRARLDQEKYAEDLIMFRAKDEECILLKKRLSELKSKYDSLKTKVQKYQNHCRNKEQNYLDRIRQTEVDCRSRLLELKTKTKETFITKNKQVEQDLLEMQRYFDQELEKVKGLNLKTLNAFERDIIHQQGDSDEENCVPPQTQTTSTNQAAGINGSSGVYGNDGIVCVTPQVCSAMLDDQNRINTGTRLEPSVENLNKVC